MKNAFTEALLLLSGCQSTNFLNKLIFQRDWLVGWACQVGRATVTKLNSSVMDVSDEVPWNHGEASSISHYLFAGKRLGSGVWRWISPSELVLRDWRALQNHVVQPRHWTDEETEARDGERWPEDEHRVSDTAGRRPRALVRCWSPVSRTVSAAHLLWAQCFVRQSLLRDLKGM